MNEDWLRFEIMTREELRAAYIENIGYDPCADDPSLTDAEIREYLEVHAAEVLFSCAS